MRFITFLGLTMIAKCINPLEVSRIGGFIMVIIIVSLIIDAIEFYKKYFK